MPIALRRTFSVAANPGIHAIFSDLGIPKNRALRNRLEVGVPLDIFLTPTIGTSIALLRPDSSEGASEPATTSPYSTRSSMRLRRIPSD